MSPLPLDGQATKPSAAGVQDRGSKPIFARRRAVFVAKRKFSIVFFEQKGLVKLKNATDLDTTLATIFDRAADIMDEVATARALLRAPTAGADRVPIGYRYTAGGEPSPIYAEEVASNANASTAAR